jgi:hypothetical protein
MGNKKNKRLSTASAASIKLTDTIERTPENDYGVLSDPDEVNETHLNTPSPTATPVMAQTSENTHESPQKKPSSSPQHTPQIPPSSQPEPLHQMSQSLRDPKQETTSLQILKLKLSSDKKFKEKMTLHTFFSFIVMALDIVGTVKVSISSAYAAATFTSDTTKETKNLVEYLIHNHSVNEYTKTYLTFLLDTNIVQHIIESILQFGYEDPINFTKLVSDEQDTATTAATAATTTDTAAAAAAAIHALNTSSIDNQSQPTSQEPPRRIRNFFKKLFGGCCCCCSRKSQAIILKDSEMTQTHHETIPKSDSTPTPTPTPTPEESSV